MRFFCLITRTGELHFCGLCSRNEFDFTKGAKRLITNNIIFYAIASLGRRYRRWKAAWTLLNQSILFRKCLKLAKFFNMCIISPLNRLPFQWRSPKEDKRKVEKRVRRQKNKQKGHCVTICSSLKSKTEGCFYWNFVKLFFADQINIQQQK